MGIIDVIPGQILPTITNTRMINQINDEIRLASIQIEGIKREFNSYTAFGAYTSYVALKRLAFGTTGRVLDFLATFMGGIKQGIDGRIYGVDSYFKSLGKIMSIYAPNAASSLTTASGVVSLNPVLTATGVGMRLGSGILYQTFAKKELAKINQILYRLGAFDYLGYRDDDNVSSFVNKLNLTEEALAALKTLNPFSSMSQVEVINKSVPSLAVFYETKIKDLNGKEHSLLDAFDVDKDFNLIWKEAEFGSQEAAGYNWYKGFNMQQVISKVYAVQTFVNGDYDVTKSKYGDSKIKVRALMLLRRFMGEFIKARIGGESIEEDSGNLYVGSYRATYTSIQRIFPKWRKNESDKQKEARKIGLKLLGAEIAMLLGLFGVGFLLKSSLAGDDDDELAELTWWEELEYKTTTAIDRLLMEHLQFVNPNILIGKANTGMVSPIFGDMMDAGNIIVAIKRAFTEGDTMSHQEMIGKNLAPRNPKKWVYKEGTKYTNPKMVEKYYNPTTGETSNTSYKISETGQLQKVTSRVGKYSKDYSPESRIGYNSKKLFPLLNLYVKYQRDEKKAREMKMKKE